MKKKGLIISTIVMVVVLIASLTTATYAWFSQASSAQVEQVNLTVGAVSDVAIGLYKSGTETSQAAYVSGNVTYTNDNSSLWTGSAGLGASINTGLNLNITAGVGTANTSGAYAYTAVSHTVLQNGDSTAQPAVPARVEQSNNQWVWKANGANDLYYLNSSNVYTAVGEAAYSTSTTYYTRTSAAAEMDPSFTRAHANALYKASGDSFATLNTPTPAIINGSGDADHNTDVLDLKMAIKPVKPDIYGTYCVITIEPTSEFVGMAAALCADIKIGDTQYAPVDLFGSTTYDVTATGQYKFYFDIDEYNGTSQMAANGTTVTPFTIRLFVSGYDEDCVASATGTGATIDIQFFGTKKVDSAASRPSAEGATQIQLQEEV